MLLFGVDLFSPCFYIESPLNLEGHPNCITGSIVMEILLNVLFLPIDGASAVEGLRSTGLPRLVFVNSSCETTSTLPQ